MAKSVYKLLELTGSKILNQSIDLALCLAALYKGYKGIEVIY